MPDMYICIDLKSYYASVECVARGLDPLRARLLVADESRTDQTICLAVSPALKAVGVPSRPRLFEARRAIREAEARSRTHIEYIVAPPRMQLYLDTSAEIYGIYLRYVSQEDIHVYSIDECFIHAAPYLHLYHGSAHDLAMTLIRDVLKSTGITATVGIGTNLYLAKVAMDIVAKKAPPDRDGVRIAELDEKSYCRLLWPHVPITDFWMVAAGTSRRLYAHDMFTMGDVARMSLRNEEMLYSLFGVNAELLIDHAWGQEHCTMEDIKAYRPSSRSRSVGPGPTTFGKRWLFVRRWRKKSPTTSPPAPWWRKRLFSMSAMTMSPSIRDSITGRCTWIFTAGLSRPTLWPQSICSRPLPPAARSATCFRTALSRMFRPSCSSGAWGSQRRTCSPRTCCVSSISLPTMRRRRRNAICRKRCWTCAESTV